MNMRVRWLAAFAFAGAFAAAACSSDSDVAGPDAKIAAQTGAIGTTGGTDTSHTPPPTSTGVVTSVSVSPKTVTIPLGGYAVIGVTGLDVNGVRVANTKATLRSGDPAIVVVSDTGMVHGKALGTAKVYGTIDGHTDSASVTVISAPSQPTPPPPGPVASFDLTAVFVGPLAGTDTSRVEPVAGATIKLSRIGGTSGDTLSTPVDAGSALTDARGSVSFKGLVGGSYSVEVTPAAGSPYKAMKTGFGPPRTTAVHMQLVLTRK